MFIKCILIFVLSSTSISQVKYLAYFGVRSFGAVMFIIVKSATNCQRQRKQCRSRRTVVPVYKHAAVLVISGGRTKVRSRGDAAPRAGDRAAQIMWKGRRRALEGI